MILFLTLVTYRMVLQKLDPVRVADLLQISFNFRRQPILNAISSPRIYANTYCEILSP